VRDAIVFLFLRTGRNWARRVARRLRSPRYAIAVLVGAGYLGLILLGQRHAAGTAVPSGAISIGGGLLLMVMVAKWWLFGADRLALAFTPSEIQFLFPAPVSRSALIAFKLARAQRIILPNVLVWTFLLRRGGGTALGALPYAITMWAFFSTVSLHRLGVALTRSSVVEHGRAGLRRFWPALLVLLAVITCIWLSIRRILRDPLLAEAVDPLDLVEALPSAPPLSWLLWVFRVPLWPLEAQSVSAWLPRILGALLVTGLHALWVVRTDRAFEEAAIEASGRRAELLERLTKQRGGTGSVPRRARRWVGLAPSGHPMSAIIWKNITRLVRTASPAVVVVLLVLVVGTAGLTVVHGDARTATLTMLATLALAWSAVLAVFGPHWVRIDLRGEMEHLALLRTWPVSGATLVTGQVLSSTLVLTVMELLLTGTGLLALGMAGESLPRGRLIAAMMPVAILVLTGLNLMAVALQNAAALLFPTWVRTEIRPGGVEQTGQHLLTAGISILLLGAAAVGPGLLGTAVSYLLWQRLGEWALVPAGLSVAAGLLLEAMLFLDWLGTRFERTDPSALD
jgi:hypothetical protein